MTIWSAEIKELETLSACIKGRFPELEKDLEHLLKTDDENVVLLYSRRCLEIIVTDLCERELKRPRKTEPLKGIIDKLHREEKVPSHIITSMESLNSLSTYGTHPKEFDPEQVRPILLNLATIIKWYIKFKDTRIIDQVKPEKSIHERKESVEIKEGFKKSKKRLIFLLSGILLVLVIVIVALFVFNIIGGKKETKELEKSIAVLPFVNDSQDEENTYFINGIMEEVLLNLQRIKDLKVPGRTSVEQYRNPTKTIPQIAKELGVNYLVEGSGQKYGNTFRLRVQLLEGEKGWHLWGESYEQPIESPEDIFNIQSQIAQAIAAELKAIITPEEKQLISKTPTANLTAYDFYQRGREEYSKYLNDNNNKEALEKAENYYHTALEYDSGFALAYTGLARIYWNKHFWSEYFAENFMDSVLILADIALSYDNNETDGYILKGNYYRAKGDKQRALAEYDKALKNNPNSWEAYRGKGDVYWNDDPVKVLENYHKAASLNHGPELPALLRNIAGGYFHAGFIDIAGNYNLEAYKLDGDSIIYLSQLGNAEAITGNYEKAIKYWEMINAIDSTRGGIDRELGMRYSYSGQYKESLRYFKKYIERLEKSGILNINEMQRIGYAYWQNGFKKEAEYYFDKQMEYCNSLIKSDRPYAQKFYTYYDRAGIYAFRGNKEKVYEDLRIFNQRQSYGLWMVTLIKNDPLFDNIRNEPEFQQIVRDVEAKYQAEHERVRRWMEEQGI